MVDSDKREIMFNSRDVFHHHMSATVRWFELELPSLLRLKALHVFAINPLFFNTNGSAVTNR